MSENLDDGNVDALYDKIMGSSESDGPTGATAPVEAAPATAPAPVDDYEFVHNGKQVRANRENVLKWASQGYDYSQKMADFNRRLNETNSKYSQAEELSKTYGPVDEWVKANPGKWDALQKAIDSTETSGANPELLQKLKGLEEQVLKASKFIESTQAAQEQERIAKEDSDLDAEIKSIREKHANLDWNSANENGQSALELRILEHASKNGIHSFRAAFNDLLHDDLMKAAESRGRASLTNERKVKESVGLLGTTPAPTKGLTKPTNLKTKTYDDLAREGLEELGFSS